jgi:lipoprotein-releasing system ATP-binding protein
VLRRDVNLFVIEHVYKSYAMGDQQVPVLRDLSTAVRAGEFVALLGKSGSGKSTLLHLLGTLDRPTSGKIFFRNQDLTRMGARQLSEFRNKNLGFVFQFHHLLPEFTALENVLMPAWIGRSVQGRADRTRALELLERLELGHRVTHKPAQLSGGEQQRVAIARALMNRPAAILADEPTGNLDDQTSRPLVKLLRDLNRAEGISFVIATHDGDLAESADRLVRLFDGQVHDERGEDDRRGAIAPS